MYTSYPAEFLYQPEWELPIKDTPYTFSPPVGINSLYPMHNAQAIRSVNTYHKVLCATQHLPSTPSVDTPYVPHHQDALATGNQ
jgi:hypothetical protein